MASGRVNKTASGQVVSSRARAQVRFNSCLGGVGPPRSCSSSSPARSRTQTRSPKREAPGPGLALAPRSGTWQRLSCSARPRSSSSSSATRCHRRKPLAAAPARTARGEEGPHLAEQAPCRGERTDAVNHRNENFQPHSRRGRAPEPQGRKRTRCNDVTGQRLPRRGEGARDTFEFARPSRGAAHAPCGCRRGAVAAGGDAGLWTGAPGAQRGHPLPPLRGTCRLLLTGLGAPAGQRRC